MKSPIIKLTQVGHILSVECPREQDEATWKIRLHIKGMGDYPPGRQTLKMNQLDIDLQFAVRKFVK